MGSEMCIRDRLEAMWFDKVRGNKANVSAGNWLAVRPKRSIAIDGCDVNVLYENKHWTDCYKVWNFAFVMGIQDLLCLDDFQACDSISLECSTQKIFPDPIDLIVPRLASGYHGFFERLSDTASVLTSSIEGSGLSQQAPCIHTRT